MKKKLILLFTCLITLTLCYAQEENAFTYYGTESSIVNDICFTQKGEAIGIADKNSVKVYATKSGEILTEFKGVHKKQVLALAIANDSSLLLSGGKDSTVVVWNFITSKAVRSLAHHKGIVTSLHLSPDNKYLVSGATDKKAYVYDLTRNEIVHELADHQDDITAVKFSPDGSLIATAGGDKQVKLYNAKTGKLVASLSGHKSWVRDIAFSSDAKKLISCGDDGRLITWNITDTKNIRIQDDSKPSFGWLLSADINKDNKTVAYGGVSGKVTIVTQFYNYHANIGKPINKLLFVPNEQHYLQVAVATRGKGVVLIDVKNLKSKNL